MSLAWQNPCHLDGTVLAGCNGKTLTVSFAKQYTADAAAIEHV